MYPEGPDPAGHQRQHLSQGLWYVNRVLGLAHTPCRQGRRQAAVVPPLFLLCM